ncbi:MAG: hypothetical protein JXA21_12800 [Anaerolineae bacterium]|nr:hypothetical protein [Anaerolineae bacterium]
MENATLNKILVAVPDELGEILCQFLEQDDFLVFFAATLNDALSAIQMEDFHAIVMTSN